MTMMTTLKKTHHHRVFSRYLLLGFLISFCLSAEASLGPFEHGAGIKAMGFGGVSYVGATETTALSANPALALSLGDRYDAGVNLMMLNPEAAIKGNSLGADEKYFSRRSWPVIPQFGVSKSINEQWAWGLTVLQAGLGPKFHRSPYQRFGGTGPSSLKLGSASLATALSWQPVENHQIGAGLILGYQFFSVNGLQFLASNDPATQVSVTPDKVTNQGKDDAFSAGFSLGWTGQLTKTISAGAGYRSNVWTQKLSDYRGLLPNGGELELPPSYGIGIAMTPNNFLTLGIEWQRYEYSAVKAFSNPLSNLEKGKLLGSRNGPGFGWRDQDSYKFGVAWKHRPNLELRLGYVYSDQVIRKSGTLFSILAPTPMEEHYSSGFTYTAGELEFSGVLAYAPENTVKGRNSIPSALGGGNAHVKNDFYSFGFSVGKRF
jgi:long-chain fatty acid transport protein